MRRRPLLIAALLTAAVVVALAASTAFANGTIDWTGQGTHNGLLGSSKCGNAADTAGMDFPPGADEDNYLLWVLSPVDTSQLTSVTLTTNGDTVTWPTSEFTNNQGSNIKFVTTGYDLSTLTASVSYVGTIDGSPDLKISHGCIGGTATPEISTEASSSEPGGVGTTVSDTAFTTG